MTRTAYGLAVLVLIFLALSALGFIHTGPTMAHTQDTSAIRLRILADRLAHQRDSVIGATVTRERAKDSSWRVFVDSIRVRGRVELQKAAQEAGRRARAEALAKDSGADVEAPGDSQCVVETPCTLERWRQTADSLRVNRIDSLEKALLVARAMATADLAQSKADSASAPPARPPAPGVIPYLEGGLAGTALGALLWAILF